MAELTWENGQLLVNGLEPGLTRVSSQHNLNSPTTAKEEWNKSRAAVGTLESIVDLATQKKKPPPPAGKGSNGVDDGIEVSLLDCRGIHHDQQRSSNVVGSLSAPAASVTNMDALVPCVPTPPSTCVVGGSTRVEIEKGRLQATRVPLEGECRSIQQSESGGVNSSRHVLTVDTCEDSGGFGLATASFCSQGRTLSLSSSEFKPATTADDHDSVCLSRPQGDTCDEEDKKKGMARSSLSTKRSRAAAIHNQSERKRRETINQKMKMLQKMVPNSSETDKASMLDEVIDYLKQLQAQVHMLMMSRMSIPSMMMPFAMPHHPLHMPMIPPMGMGIDMNMNIINSAMMARQNLASLSPVINPNSPFMPMATWDVATEKSSSSTSTLGSTDPSTYLSRCQSQPMTMEAYNRMVTLIQQQQLASTTTTKN